MEPTKFLVLGYIIFSTACECHAERKLELKPVKLITQVLSRNDAGPSLPGGGDQADATEIHELCPEERERVCEEGREMMGPEFQTSTIGATTELREYVIEIEQTTSQSSQSSGRRIVLEFVKAFECPTILRMLIQVHTFNGRPDYSTKLSVIFKSNDDLDVPKLENIMGYQIQPTQSVTEAFSDELKSLDPKILVQVRSFFDADALNERQCRQICEKAVFMLPEKNVSSGENTTVLCSMNKYYFVEGGSSASYDESGGKVAIQAFECSTRPKIYVHVDGDMDMWFMMEGSDLRLLHYNIMGYQLKPFVEIKQVDSKTVKLLMKNNALTMMNARSRVDFNNHLSPDKRLQFCRDTVQIMFGTRVRLLEHTEIARSEFYGVQLTSDQNTMRSTIVEAIVCPTDDSVFGRTYLHVSQRHNNSRENIVQLFVQRRADYQGDYTTRLSAWTDD